MKLAEALQERADLNRRIEQTKHRLNNNIVMQEGVPPVEDPKQLFRELDECLDRLEALTAAINRTNMTVRVEGKTLTELLARRDKLAMKLSILRDAVNCAANLSQRSRGSEIRQMASVDVRAMQKKNDELAKEFRLLDNTVQAANWANELMGL